VNREIPFYNLERFRMMKSWITLQMNIVNISNVKLEMWNKIISKGLKQLSMKDE